MTVTTPTSPAAWRPDQTARFQIGAMVPDALPLVAATSIGTIEGDAPAVRVPFLGADPTTGFYAEGAVITASDPARSELVFNTAKIAALSVVSRESLLQPLDVASALFMSFQRALRRKANQVFLNNPPTSGQPTGLLRTTGVTSAGALDASLDAVANAISLIEAADGNPEQLVIIADPLAWGQMRKMKSTAGGGVPLLGPPSADATRTLFGVAVIVSNQMPFTAPTATVAGSGAMLVIDRSAVISAWSDVNIISSSDAYFSADSVGIRATCRLGFGVVWPDRIAKISVVLPATG